MTVRDEIACLRDSATEPGPCLQVPAKSIAPEDARDQFGSLAGFAVINLPASSAITRQRFGWQPVEPGLIADLDEEGHYSTQSSNRDQDATEG